MKGGIYRLQFKGAGSLRRAAITPLPLMILMWLACALAWSAANAGILWAQGQTVARVASVQRVVEQRGAATPFRKVGAGASLRVSDSLRTGKRSKADLKFADGSLLRMGQISSIEIQSAKGVRLSGGRLLYAALRPGRVLAGNGTAEIKGSVAVIGLRRDNSADFTLYSGSMDVSADRTVTLAPGQTVRVDAQGRLLRVRRAPPFGFIDGELHPDLLDIPERGPFVGSDVHERIREEEDRTSVDQLLPLGNPIAVSDNGIPRGQPFPTPFPTRAPGSAQALHAVRPSARTELSPISSARPSRSELSWSRSLASRSPLTARSSQRLADAPMLQLAAAPSASRIISSVKSTVTSQIADSPAPPSTSEADASTSIASASTSGVESVVDFDLDTRPALDHIDDVDRGLGRIFSGEARIVGAASDDDASIYGLRLRGYGAVGQAFFEGTLVPQQLRRDGETRDYSTIGTGFLLLRDTRGEIRIGRQRFVAGPTQAAFFGSMIRQGGRETMDAIRIATRPRNGIKLEGAYIYDAFPRNLPFQISGAQKALYGRASLRRNSLNLGLNGLKYTSSDVDDALGATVDFALPLSRDEVEFYGELGRDPFKRRLTTFGLTFPGLFERTDFDAYLEYARLSERANLGAPPSEVTLRVYRRFGDSVNSIATLSRFGGGEGWSLSLGVAIGGRSDRRYATGP